MSDRAGRTERKQMRGLNGMKQAVQIIPCSSGWWPALNLSWLLLAVSLLLLTGCKKSVLTGGPVDGVVIDVTTQQPIAGAMVLVRWHGVLPTLHSNSVPCYHAELATTDDQGKYHISRWEVETKGHVEWMADISQTGPIEPVAYKPGYVMPQRYHDDPTRVLIEPFQGTTLQRLGYLAGEFYQYKIACEADNKIQIPIYQAAYAEGLKIARSPAELRELDHLLVELESAELGNTEALRRSGIREAQRLEKDRK
jgi:hypothetical protein